MMGARRGKVSMMGARRGKVSMMGLEGEQSV